MRHDLPMSAITEGVMPDKAWKQERHKAEWRIGDTINASIGQGYVLTSPLQLAVMTARLASGHGGEAPPRPQRSATEEMPDAPPEPLGRVARTSARGARGHVCRGQRAGRHRGRVAHRGRGDADGGQDRHQPGAQHQRGRARARAWSRTTSCPGIGATMRCSWATPPRKRHAIACSVVVEHGGGGSPGRRADRARRASARDDGRRRRR